MQEGHVAKLKVKIVLVKHEEKLFEGYQDEIGYLVEHEGRNKFIRNLACDLERKYPGTIQLCRTPWSASCTR